MEQSELKEQKIILMLLKIYFFTHLLRCCSYINVFTENDA